MAVFALGMLVLTPAWAVGEYLSSGGWPQRLSPNGNPGDSEPVDHLGRARVGVLRPAERGRRPLPAAGHGRGGAARAAAAGRALVRLPSRQPGLYREWLGAGHGRRGPRVAATLPRAYEAFVRGRVKFRVGQIVFLAFSKDGTVMGIGFPKDWRAAARRVRAGEVLAAERIRHALQLGHVRLDVLDHDEMRDLVEDAWALCVPKYVAAEYAAARGYG